MDRIMLSINGAPRIKVVEPGPGSNRSHLLSYSKEGIKGMVSENLVTEVMRCAVGATGRMKATWPEKMPATSVRRLPPVAHSSPVGGSGRTPTAEGDTT